MMTYFCSFPIHSVNVHKIVMQNKNVIDLHNCVDVKEN